MVVRTNRTVKGGGPERRPTINADPRGLGFPRTDGAEQQPLPRTVGAGEQPPDWRPALRRRIRRAVKRLRDCGRCV